jgi:hypothetical protein
MWFACTSDITNALGSSSSSIAGGFAVVDGFADGFIDDFVDLDDKASFAAFFANSIFRRF